MRTNNDEMIAFRNSADANQNIYICNWQDETLLIIIIQFIAPLKATQDVLVIFQNDRMSNIFVKGS